MLRPEKQVGVATADAHPTTQLEQTPAVNEARQDAPQQQDHVQQLAATVTAALKQRSKVETVILSRLQQRAELYEKAYVQAKQATIDQVDAHREPAARRARQRDALHRPDLAVIAPEMVVKLAAIDARQTSALRDPVLRAAAVLALADTARLSTGYRAALANASPTVSAAVERAIATTEMAKQGRAGLAPSNKSESARDQPGTEKSRDPFPSAESQAGAQNADRARRFKRPAAQTVSNSIERVIESTLDAQRTATAAKRANAKAQAPDQGGGPRQPARGGNRVESDEVFTAVKDERKPIVPVEVEDKYLRVGRKFYHPKNTQVVAFEDKGNKLETRSNSEQIVGAMVAIARARGWDEIKVTGSETFRKEVWLEAGAQGMQVKGYTPSEVDKAELAKRARYVDLNKNAPDARPSERTRRVDSTAPNAQRSPLDASKAKEPSAQPNNPPPKPEDHRRAQRAPADAVADYPELAGAYAAMTLIDKKIAADGLSTRQRAVVMAQVQANLVNSIERGQLPQVQVREQAEAQRERVPAKEVTR